MAISTFGVTHADIRAHYFPALVSFSTTTKPTLATVTEMIEAEAAVLTGKLSSEGLTASVIAADATTAGYAWCKDVIRTGAAIRAMTAMAGSGAVPKEWITRLEARYEELENEGGAVLGDIGLPAQDANGPRSHVLSFGLDTGDDADVSEAIPRHRRDDRL